MPSSRGPWTCWSEATRTGWSTPGSPESRSSQAGSEGSSVAVADLVKTSAGGREVRTRIEPVSPDRVEPDPEMAALVESYRRRADSITSRVVATIKLPLSRAGEQHRLGGLIAEARRNVLRADVGLVGNAGIRADLPAGPVTYGQLFEIQPSQNSLVKLTLTGTPAPGGAGACPGARQPARRRTSPVPGSATIPGVLRDSGCRASSCSRGRSSRPGPSTPWRWTTSWPPAVTVT